MRLTPIRPALALALLMSAVPAHAEDEWWARDKALHFGVSGVLAGAGYAASSLFVEAPLQRLAVGGAVALSAGLAKGVYDEIDYGGASYKDLVFDVAGVAVGVVAAWLIDSATKDDSRTPVAANGHGLRVHF